MDDEGALLLGIDLNSLDVDSLLGPLATRGSKASGLFRQRPPRVGVEGTRADEVISAQKKALEQPAPTQLAKAKAAHCLAHGPALVGGKCGERLYFTVTTVSEDGQVMKEGGATVTCMVTGISLMSKTQPEPRPFVEDRQDGTYHVQFVCATPGSYEINAYVDGNKLPMCPVMIHVSPGPPSATTTQVRGDGVQRCTLGGSAEFNIQAMDEFGNLCGEGGARFGVRASAHVRLHEVSDNEDGTYTVTYSVPEWAHGPAKLEVLLDGHPIRGSPLTPRVIGYNPEKLNEAKAKGKGPGQIQKGAGGSLTDQLPSLRWLRENPPLPVPVTSMAVTGGLRVPDQFGHPTPEASASRIAWSAADEWRRLAEVRSELERCRDQLVEHQAVLLHVGDAIHSEVDRLQEWERGIRVREDELGDVEKQLEGMRSEIQKQYLTQKRILETMGGKDEARRSPSPVSSPPSRTRPAIDAPAAGTGASEGATPHTWPEKASAARVARAPKANAEEELMALQRGIEQKKRQLRVLEEEAGNAARPLFSPSDGGSPGILKSSTPRERPLHPMLESRMLSELAPPPTPPPLDAAPPPDFGHAGRPRAGRSARPMADGVPPPSVEATFSLTEPALDLSVGRSPGVGLLRAPPPPPAPPPSIQTGGLSLSRGASPTSASETRSPQSSYVGASGTASPEELGQAMKQLFHAFASRAAGSVAKPGGGRSGRVALGLQDYLRLAQASQLRLSPPELEAVFHETTERFGSPADSGEPALAFELFVELLVETARRQFADLKDAESAAALFEVHLLPLARRLRRAEGASANAQVPAGMQ
ncbi:unnamed protein product [Effrenium voratum]|uniref:Uncharacterized protein n=1 Tax=Effrenium voratum TaxID=2562239 RepID=A0AA36JR18_9DINO|nr:unnamed protein product [Effrenium voratum]